MSRTITVRGTGSISVSPDYIVITMDVKSVDKDYEKTMEKAAIKVDALNNALAEIGFDKKAVKTVSFNVDTEYESIRDKDGNYRSVFRGYSCYDRLKVEFDFDSLMLAKTLGVISACIAEPELSIYFTVKDKAAVSEKLLESAAVNARSKAQILCKASDVRLGELMSIDYNWKELNVFSKTHYSIDKRCMEMPTFGIADMQIEPDDISLNDSVTFVWEIE